MKNGENVLTTIVVEPICLSMVQLVLNILSNNKKKKLLQFIFQNVKNIHIFIACVFFIMIKAL